jgi:CDP-diglyceride synthetase
MSDAVTEIAKLAPSDLLGLCFGVIGALLVLFGAYYASVLISKDPRDIEPGQKLTAVGLLLFGLVLSLTGLSGALWTELTQNRPPASAGDSANH